MVGWEQADERNAFLWWCARTSAARTKAHGRSMSTALAENAEQYADLLGSGFVAKARLFAILLADRSATRGVS